ncbi:hypothetical protein IEU95_12085 [Hoyosella rhizosphaerae]|uniref:Porin n=1 Tax=Hoyosella rhizosphaerae TaxID=1755582 RepID=A0A916U873_9ACTN|nr:hypothetical protein [Hoyosella rhizosphaerae]MBN4927573.1 hypothetical protein [Hoyosella rhizosphaerae]GGC63409.1 hypothetical protein GCM10011410_14820 [Hoyosella rhizosphaerae]
MKAFKRAAAVVATSAALTIPFAGAASAQEGDLNLGGGLDLGSLNLGVDGGAGGGFDLGAFDLGALFNLDLGAGAEGGAELDFSSLDAFFGGGVQFEGPTFDLQAEIDRIEADFQAFIEANFGGDVNGGGAGGEGDFTFEFNAEQAWADFVAQVEADIAAAFGGGAGGGVEVDFSSIELILGGGVGGEAGVGGDLGGALNLGDLFNLNVDGGAGFGS